jgi:hypothetical protein
LGSWTSTDASTNPSFAVIAGLRGAKQFRSSPAGKWELTKAVRSNVVGSSTLNVVGVLEVTLAVVGVEIISPEKVRV